MNKQNSKNKIQNNKVKIAIPIIVVTLLISAVGTYLISSSDAARPAKSGSITLDTTIYPNPQLGDTISFNATVSKSVRNGRIQVRCSQNNVLVYAEAGPYTGSFTLGGASSDWKRNGGAANCKADLLDLWWNGKNDPQNVQILDSILFYAEDNL